MPNGDLFEIRCKQCGCDEGVYACCGGIPLPRILYADIVSAPKPPAAVYECYSAGNVALNYQAPQAPSFEHQWIGTTVFTDGCGNPHDITITLTCVAGSEETDANGNVRGDFIATIELEAPLSIPTACTTTFPPVKATSCSPLMVGDNTWGDLGTNGLNLAFVSCGGFVPSAECIECAYGVSLRVSE
jgi:hypothetical protein